MPPLRIYNTMSLRKEVFRPLKQGRVTMFVCGPTVQGPIHVGHARTYTFYDVVSRYLRHLGFEVEFLMNITDIDESISSAAEAAGADPTTFARRNTERFLEDLEALGISSVTRFELVSGHIRGAVDQVSQLLNRRKAYEVGGWVYFDTSTFPGFGKLSHQSKAALSLRPLELSSRKRNLADFSLWRPEELVEGKWESPWGLGSPGWHVQDTAITMAVFGPKYDIHGGAYELIYPHHEAEIALVESLAGVEPMVGYWVHTHLLTTEGEKMSKSVGNVYNVKDALRRFSADELRFHFLLHHYRKDMDLSDLRASVGRLSLLREAAKHLRSVQGETKHVSTGKLLARFYSAMDDDFDTPSAIVALEGLAEDATKEGGRLRHQAAEAMRRASGILGVQLLG